MKLIMPMAGKAQRFNKDSDRIIIKPLIEVNGRTLLEWSMTSFSDLSLMDDIVFIIQKKHNELLKHLEGNYPQAKVQMLDRETRGPGETLTYAMGEIDDGPVIICDCDLYFTSTAFNLFLKNPDSQICMGVLTFNSTNPQYSYISQTDGKIEDIVEKKVISTSAVCGCYYFSSGNLLKELLTKTLDQITDREVFLSDVIKTGLLKGLTARAFPCDQHISLGTPDDISRNAFLLPRNE